MIGKGFPPHDPRKNMFKGQCTVTIQENINVYVRIIMYTIFHITHMLCVYRTYILRTWSLLQ